MRVLVKNGTIVTADNEFKADILIEDEKISAIGTHLTAPLTKSSMPPGNMYFPAVWITTHILRR